MTPWKSEFLLMASAANHAGKLHFIMGLQAGHRVLTQNCSGSTFFRNSAHQHYKKWLVLIMAK